MNDIPFLSVGDVCLYDADVSLLRSKNAWLNDAVLSYVCHRRTNSTTMCVPPTVAFMLRYVAPDEKFAAELAAPEVVVLPLNDSGADGGSGTHWSILMVTEHEAIHYDSMYPRNQHVAIETLANWKGRRSIPTRGAFPAQKNAYDCGVFACVAMELISEGKTVVPSEVASRVETYRSELLSRVEGSAKECLRS